MRWPPKKPRLPVKGVTNSGGSGASAGLGGLVLATSHGFLGQYVGSRFSRSVSVIAGEGTGMERDYDYSSRLHFADLDSPEEIGRKAGERAVRRLNPRKAQTGPVTWSSIRAWRAALPAIWPARSTALRSRARPASCAT